MPLGTHSARTRAKKRLQGSEVRLPTPTLIFATLAGEEIQLAIDPREYDRLHGFENAVLEQLPYLGDSTTFGCELQFVQMDTPSGTSCVPGTGFT